MAKPFSFIVFRWAGNSNNSAAIVDGVRFRSVMESCTTSSRSNPVTRRWIQRQGRGDAVDIRSIPANISNTIEQLDRNLES